MLTEDFSAPKEVSTTSEETSPFKEDSVPNRTEAVIASNIIMHTACLNINWDHELK